MRVNHESLVKERSVHQRITREEDSRHERERQEDGSKDMGQSINDFP